jgi:hypothetical protein
VVESIIAESGNRLGQPPTIPNAIPLGAMRGHLGSGEGHVVAKTQTQLGETWQQPAPQCQVLPVGGAALRPPCPSHPLRTVGISCCSPGSLLGCAVLVRFRKGNLSS